MADLIPKTSKRLPTIRRCHFHSVRGDGAATGRGPVPRPLGSIIVSEVIFGALANNEIPARNGAASLTEALAELSAEYYPTNVSNKYPKLNAWISWSSSRPRSLICDRPCPHFCEPETIRLTQPGTEQCRESKDCK